MKEFFTNKNFRQESLAIIAYANKIIEAYAQAGFILTLRQLYYQFVARDLIPNTERSYKRLGGIINDGRLAGLIDWDAIEDRTRNLQSNPHWTSPRDGIESLRQQYRIDMWQNQPTRVEVWIEKEALVGVIEGVCDELDVAYFACRGYVSQSEQWRAYRRIQHHWRQNGQNTVILHLGDHDPSGIDMTRDNDDRLQLFLDPIDDICEVQRIALSMAQIEEYGPPPNPAKVTDSRFEGYLRRYGYESWELDALEPSVLTALIRDHIAEIRNDNRWAEMEAQWESELDTLDSIIEGLD